MLAPLGDESGDECSLGLTMEEHFGSPTVMTNWDDGVLR